ncbi:hypothetical protein P153DRAFT_389104 [Dothidotthia symphoricarpi CBS 119687]|uniref:Uncharacterized protein n=1 Tax=Dothidotthia symphoricarpi CBS 119687 TaxID=1392245 RepID=A0A6A6A1F1_9PLEO|nr:uncharacterized protein P153DRAFT_389104 [Dothidotthia symphoricarpi CBS 119687]KAF2125650.1 hypothetical protein P153DRAFT_389104 [Dothidotthia symphoricarpi CBS 119687]
MASRTRLETLNINSAQLGLHIHDGVDFAITNSTAISGALETVAFASRGIWAGSVSRSLLNMLSMKTNGGSVSVHVEPKPAVDGGSLQVNFKAESRMGSIRVDVEHEHSPERDYQTDVNRTDGSINGTFIHSSKTVIKSVAGLVTADLLPYKSGDYPSIIDTNTQSGQTSVTVRTPYKTKGLPMTGLVSSHTMMSGALGLAHPREWEVHVTGTSTSGILHLQGKSLELVGENDELRGIMLERGKEVGGSSMPISTVDEGYEVESGTMSGYCCSRLPALMEQTL